MELTGLFFSTLIKKILKLDFIKQQQQQQQKRTDECAHIGSVEQNSVQYI